MSIIRDTSSKTDDTKGVKTKAAKELTPEQAQIQRLKDRVSNLIKENDKLQNKIPPRVELTPSGGALQISSAIVHDGKEYKRSQSVEFGEAFKDLLPIIRQVMTITKAVTLGQDVVNKRQMAHELGLDGRPTKELMKDEDGKQVYLPNAIDRLRAAFDVLLNDLDTRKALTLIGEKLSDTDSLKEKAQEYSAIDQLMADYYAEQNSGSSDDSQRKRTSPVD